MTDEQAKISGPWELLNCISKCLGSHCSSERRRWCFELLQCKTIPTSPAEWSYWDIWSLRLGAMYLHCTPVAYVSLMALRDTTDLGTERDHWGSSLLSFHGFLNLENLIYGLQNILFPLFFEERSTIAFAHVVIAIQPCLWELETYIWTNLKQVFLALSLHFYCTIVYPDYGWQGSVNNSFQSSHPSSY